jgi:hypothetical protein
MVVSIMTTLPSAPHVPSAFFQSDPSSPALLLDVREAILPPYWLLNLQQPFEHQDENTPHVLMTIERTGECSMKRICFPPAPVRGPGACLVCCTLLWYTASVSQTPGAHDGLAASFACLCRRRLLP